MRYEILDAHPYEGDNRTHAKNVTLRANNRTVSNISKSIERTTDLKTIQRFGIRSINECYIDLTLDKLRELDDDSQAQSDYIKNRARFLEQGNIRVLIIKLSLKSGQSLEKQDYGYLLSLLNWSKNDLPIMPLLEFENVDTPIQIKTYQDFVKEMLSQRMNYDRLSDMAMSVPIYMPRRRIDSLFESYSDVKPTFVAMDFNNSRVDSKPDGKLDTIINHFINEKEEKTFIYGINVKPYKNGGESTSALDLQSIHWSLNAVGPMHSKPRPVMVPSGWDNAGRLFDGTELSYSKINDALLSDFIDWVDDGYGFRFDEDYSKNERSAYSYMKRYNYCTLNRKMVDISESLNKGETEVIDETIRKLPDGLREKFQ